MINKCVKKENAPEGPCVVRKIGKHKARTGREMRLTTKISEYEMDQVILDLGSDANIFRKQTWEIMGRHALQWSLIKLRKGNQQKYYAYGKIAGSDNRY